MRCAAAGDPAANCSPSPAARAARSARDPAAAHHRLSARHRGQPRFRHRSAPAAGSRTQRFTGLCRRAWRNTLSNRPCTGDRLKPFAPSCAGHRSRAGKASRGSDAARFDGPRSLHRIISALHRFQHAAGRSHLRRHRGKLQRARHAPDAPRRSPAPNGCCSTTAASSCTSSPSARGTSTISNGCGAPRAASTSGFRRQLAYGCGRG